MLESDKSASVEPRPSQCKPLPLYLISFVVKGIAHKSEEMLEKVLQSLQYLILQSDKRFAVPIATVSMTTNQQYSGPASLSFIINWLLCLVTVTCPETTQE